MDKIVPIKELRERMDVIHDQESYLLKILNDKPVYLKQEGGKDGFFYIGIFIIVLILIASMIGIVNFLLNNNENISTEPKCYEDMVFNYANGSQFTIPYVCFRKPL